MRAAYLGQVRVDNAETVKCLARAMAKPHESHMDPVTRRRLSSAVSEYSVLTKGAGVALGLLSHWQTRSCQQRSHYTQTRQAQEQCRRGGCGSGLIDFLVSPARTCMKAVVVHSSHTLVY
eukprot:5839125-Amphidinium_carterae.1